jgi:aspartyl-tRNA synthetase
VFFKKAAPPGRTDVLVPARTNASTKEYALQRSQLLRGLIFNMQQTIILAGEESVKGKLA